MPATFQRRILHHGPTPAGTPLLLSDRAVSGCWFDLHRRGGCGAGELILRDEFPQRHQIDIGDWISCEAAEGDRWYLGRVEERHSNSPAEVRLRLEGMGIELTETFPGGFATDVDGVPPHRFAATDLFPNDPDWSLETVDSLMSAEELVRKLIETYVVPATHIALDSALIETPRHHAPLGSLKFRGEESIASIVKELGLRAQASWGVDSHGRFFFLQSRTTPLASWREGRDVTALSETRDREHLFNRVLLTGDYIYDHRDATYDIARRSFRWRGNYTQPDSRALYGDRRIRLWIPWLRTDVDSLAFVREFFRIYSLPTARFSVETTPQTTLPLPWEGRVRLEDRDGETLFIGPIESMRVLFDHAPRWKLELGPEDPRNLWPEPPHDERWELPAGPPPGGPVSMTTQPSASSDFTLETTTITSTGETSDDSSGLSSNDLSESASDGSSEVSDARSTSGLASSASGSSVASENSSGELSSGLTSAASTDLSAGGSSDSSDPSGANSSAPISSEWSDWSSHEQSDGSSASSSAPSSSGRSSDSLDESDSTAESANSSVESQESDSSGHQSSGTISGHSSSPSSGQVSGSSHWSDTSPSSDAASSGVNSSLESSPTSEAPSDSHSGASESLSSTPESGQSTSSRQNSTSSDDNHSDVSSAPPSSGTSYDSDLSSGFSSQSTSNHS